MPAHASFISNQRSYLYSHLGARKKLHHLECDEPCSCNFITDKEYIGILNNTSSSNQCLYLCESSPDVLDQTVNKSNMQQVTDPTILTFCLCEITQAFPSSCLFLSDMGDVVFLLDHGLSHQF